MFFNAHALWANVTDSLNSLPDMPILGFSNTAENRYDIKNMDKWEHIYLIEWKTLWEKE